MTGDQSSVKSGLLPDAIEAYQQGRLDRSEKLCRLQLKFQPDDLNAKTQLAIVLCRTNRTSEAIDLLQDVISVQPTYTAWLCMYAIKLATQQFEDAASAALRAVDLDPAELETYRKVGFELARHQRPDLAAEFFAMGLTQAPDDLNFRVDLANALDQSGRKEESMKAWAEVTRLHPDFALGWLQYGRMQMSSRGFLEARRAGREAIRCAPDNLDSYMLTGLACAEMARADEAEGYFIEALRINPRYGLAKASLAGTKYERGQFEEANRLFKESLEGWPTNGLAYYSEFRSKKVTEADTETIRTIQSLTERDDVPYIDRSFLEYALGKAFEDLKEYEKAISHYDRANDAAFQFWRSEKPWHPDKYRETMGKTIDLFNSRFIDSLRSAPLESDLPVLIVGMIRSGTSLLEQILSSHPEIIGAGELTYWHEEAGKFVNVEKGAVDVGKLRSSAQAYLDLLREHSPSAKRITDKLPHNYVTLGFVHPILPNARIIHIRRNPIDNCFSVYATAYSQPPGFTLVRENIVTAYQEYMRLMEHWRETLPKDRFFEVDYEELVGNREYEARRLINFLGLEWNDACLYHEKNERVVHTPSTWQVRQPLYKTSIERWRKFEPWIAPFDQLPAEHPPLGW